MIYSVRSYRQVQVQVQLAQMTVLQFFPSERTCFCRMTTPEVRLVSIKDIIERKKDQRQVCNSQGQGPYDLTSGLFL